MSLYFYLDVFTYFSDVIHLSRIGKVINPVGTDPVRESAGRQERPAREREKKNVNVYRHPDSIIQMKVFGP